VSKVFETMGTQMPALKKGRREKKKKEMNKIAHVFL
jgi:hypothetical protein